MERDGSDPVNLTENPAHDKWPTWSPDGEWIAFVSDRDGSDDVFVMRADGSDVRNLTDTEDLQESHAAWLPHGVLTFTRHGESGPITMWAATADGGSERPIETDAQPVYVYTWGTAQRQ